MSAFGISPLGTDLGPFGGPGLITVLGVLPRSTNQFVVVFDRIPRQLDNQAVNSATNASNYTLSAVDPTILPPASSEPFVPQGELVPRRLPYSAIAEADDLDPTQIIVTADSRLEPGVRYDVLVSDTIAGDDDESFVGPTEFQFLGTGLPSLQFTRVETTEARYRDLDNIIMGPRPDDPAGIFRAGPNSDLALATARVSLRKRIYRRLLTTPGGFAWAPGYGVGVDSKQLIRPGTQQMLADLVAEQVRLEPDVLDASAEVSFQNTGRGTYVLIDLAVRTTDIEITRISFRQEIG